jgi:hypothetical protein
MNGYDVEWSTEEDFKKHKRDRNWAVLAEQSKRTMFTQVLDNSNWYGFDPRYRKSVCLGWRYPYHYCYQKSVCLRWGYSYLYHKSVCLQWQKFETVSVSAVGSNLVSPRSVSCKGTIQTAATDTKVCGSNFGTSQFEIWKYWLQRRTHQFELHTLAPISELGGQFKFWIDFRFFFN